MIEYTYTYGYDVTKETYPQRIERAKNEEAMLQLDNQGRHRSEWCYAAYDGRVSKNEINDKDNTE